MGAENLAPTRIRSLDHPACSKPQYWLNYPGPLHIKHSTPKPTCHLWWNTVLWKHKKLQLHETKYPTWESTWSSSRGVKYVVPSLSCKYPMDSLKLLILLQHIPTHIIYQILIQCCSSRTAAGSTRTYTIPFTHYQWLKSKMHHIWGMQGTWNR